MKVKNDKTIKLYYLDFLGNTVTYKYCVKENTNMSTSNVIRNFVNHFLGFL